MNEVCLKCGLPKELCVCETIAKEAQEIKIRTVRRRYGKLTTVIYGMDEHSINLKDLTKKLKSSLACGGTTKENTIELQGDHRQKVKNLLVKMGFPAEQISVG